MTFVTRMNVGLLAMQTIGMQNFGVYKFLANVINSAGENINSYSPAVIKSGNIQPAQPKELLDLGLNAGKKDIVIYTTADIQGLESDAQISNGDFIQYNNNFFKVMAVRDWSAQNGWIKAYATLDNEHDIV